VAKRYFHGPTWILSPRAGLLTATIDLAQHVAERKRADKALEPHDRLSRSVATHGSRQPAVCSPMTLGKIKDRQLARTPHRFMKSNATSTLLFGILFLTTLTCYSLYYAIAALRTNRVGTAAT